MNKKYNNIKLLFLMSFTLIVVFVPYLNKTYAATSLKEIEENIMCVCKDNCGKVLANCTCEYSGTMREEIKKMLDKNMTKNDILAFYIDKYGEKVLSAPTKKGFNLIAWITPFVLVFLGAIVVWFVVDSWVKASKSKAANTDKNMPEKGGMDDKYQDKLKKELKDFDY